jgi:hypothetical protein
MFGYEYFRWVVFDHTLYEGMVDGFYIAVGRVLCVILPMLLLACVIQRWEDWNDDPRHK